MTETHMRHIHLLKHIKIMAFVPYIYVLYRVADSLLIILVERQSCLVNYILAMKGNLLLYIYISLNTMYLMQISKGT